MTTLHLRTLGELRVDGDLTAPLSSRRKELTLLTYLARRAPKAMGREELAELLWGTTSAKARQSLRQALLELKRVVGDKLETDADKVGLAAGAVILDAASFESDLANGRWREAVASWRGEFLSGIDDMGGDDFRIWLEAEREGLRRGLRLALLRLIEEARRNGSWGEGIAWAGRWVELQPLEEDGHRHLIELLHLDGRTAEALVRHAAFLSQLRAIGLEPTPAFVQLGRTMDRHAAGAAERHTPGSAALFTPDMVGRGPALAELLTAWRSARTGRAVSVLVEGEAGIGKTRLCEEFVRELAHDRTAPVVIRGRGHGPLETTRLALINQLVTNLASAPGLAGASPRALAELSVAAPALRDRFPGLPEPSASQSALEEALVEGLRVVGEERPIVLYVDDLPQADELSQRVLRSVMARLSTAILFLIAARTREDEPSSAYIELASESNVRRLKLQLLAPREVELLLESMLELPAAERQSLARRLHAQGGGNPFYTIELAAAMVEEELLRPNERGSWQLAPLNEGQLIPLSATIREVVSRRLDRLAPDVRAGLEAAAVLGRTFEADWLPVVSGLSPTSSTVALEELIARRMIRASSDSPSRYEFTHEIICRVAYDLVSPGRRETLHRAAAGVWQSRVRHSPSARTAYEYHRLRARSGPGLSRWRKRTLGVAGVLILAALLAAMLTPPAVRARLVTLLTRGSPALVAHRVVIAPLTNHTGDSALTALGELAADWIAQGLMRTTRFEVVDPRTTSLAGKIVEHIPSLLRDRNPAIALANETGSGTVVAGDLFRDGDSLRVLMRVIDAGTGKIVRAVEPVTGVTAAPSKLVTDLRRHVLASVASAVDTTSRGFSAALGDPPSYEAYTEVSEAWESFFRNDLADVFRRLQHATALDSEYMTPLLMRAYVETRVSNWPAVDTLVRRLETRWRSLTPAERAVLAGLQADLKGDLWGRLRAARELMSLTPASVEGYTLAASSALFVNRPREALAILSQIDPDRGLLLVAPFYWINQTPAMHRLGDHAAEVQSARGGLRRFPDRFWTHLNLLLALAAQGDAEALRRELPRVTRDDPAPGLGDRQKVLYAWRELRAHGHRKAAAEWLARASSPPEAPVSDTSLAGALLEGDLHGAAGQWEAAHRIYAAGAARYPGTPILLGRLGTAAVHVGDSAEARRTDRTLAALTGTYLFGSQTYARARIAAALGDKAGAVQLLQLAWAQGRPVTFDDRENEDVHADPEFDSLRDFLPFQMLTRTD